MFERYTERARRTIFFARYEASQFGTPYIEASFLLLALIREDKVLMGRLLSSERSPEQIRQEVERHTAQGKPFSTAVDVPLSDESRRVLAYASEESERLHHSFITGEHLLLGLLLEEQSLPARLLLEHGVTPEKVRDGLQEYGPAPLGIGSWASRITLLFNFPVSTVKVADLQRSIAFYIVLGFHVVQEISFLPIAIVSSGPLHVALVHESVGPNLFCFIVTDLPSLAQRLQTAGYTLEQPLTTSADGTESLLTRDPDDHMILLASGPPPNRAHPLAG